MHFSVPVFFSESLFPRFSFPHLLCLSFSLLVATFSHFTLCVLTSLFLFFFLTPAFTISVLLSYSRLCYFPCYFSLSFSLFTCSRFFFSFVSIFSLFSYFFFSRRSYFPIFLSYFLTIPLLLVFLSFSISVNPPSGEILPCIPRAFPLPQRPPHFPSLCLPPQTWHLFPCLFRKLLEFSSQIQRPCYNGACALKEGRLLYPSRRI